MPLFVNIGQIKTPEMELKVKFAGLETLFFDDKLMDEVPKVKANNALLQAKDHTAKAQSPPVVQYGKKNVPSKEKEVDISEQIKHLNVTNDQVHDDKKLSNAHVEEEEDEEDIKVRKVAIEQLPKIKSYM
jgi:hypothetical protein